MPSPRRWLLIPEAWILLAVLAARAVLAVTLGLGRDEAAYWYWAWNGLDASYSLVTVGAVRLSTALLGDSPPAMRLPGVIAGIASLGVLVAAGRRLGLERGTALLGAVALAVAPAAMFAGAAVHPDAFLVLFALVFAERAAAVDREGPGGARLIGAAAAAVCAAFSKLTGALLLLPAAWLVARRRRGRPDAAAAGVLLGGAAAGLALGMDLRVVAGVREFGRFAPGLTAGEHLGAAVGDLALRLGPALLAIGALGAWAIRRRKARRAWPAWTAAVLLAVFFGAHALAGQSKGNWFLPAFALLVPPGLAAAERSGRLRALRVITGVAVAGAGVQCALLTLPRWPPLWQAAAGSELARRVAPTYSAHVGPREAEVSPTRTWVERVEEYHQEPGVDARLREAWAGAEAIVSRDYGLAFRIAHGLGRRARVRLPWDAVYARTCDAPLAAGADVLFVSRGAAPPADWAARFREVREWPADEVGAPRVWRCEGWKGGSDAAVRGDPGGIS